MPGGLAALVRAVSRLLVARGLRHAALGGGGMGLVGAAGWGLLRLEAKLARRAIPLLGGAPLCDGVYGEGDGPLLRLGLLGDSSAAGLGADRPQDTPGALLAAALAADLAASGRRVHLEVAAISGARSPDLDAQVNRLLLAAPDIAVISIGANDVTHGSQPREATAHLARAIERLTGAGARVVVGSCPDLGIMRPIPQPLRRLAHLRSVAMAAAQRVAGEAAGARVVPLGALLGHAFGSDPGLFCGDRFHPSAAGYGRIAGALLPAVRAAAGLDSTGPATGLGTGAVAG